VGELDMSLRWLNPNNDNIWLIIAERSKETNLDDGSSGAAMNF